MKTTTRKSTPPYHNSVFNLQRRKRFRGSHRRLRVRERIWWVFASHDVATSRIARVVVIFFGFFIQREGEGDGCHSIPRWPRKETSRKRARTLADKPCVEHTPFEKFNRAGVDAANDIAWCSYYGLQWRFRGPNLTFFFSSGVDWRLRGAGAPFFRFEKNFEFESLNSLFFSFLKESAFFFAKRVTKANVATKHPPKQWSTPTEITSICTSRESARGRTAWSRAKITRRFKWTSGIWVRTGRTRATIRLLPFRVTWETRYVVVECSYGCNSIRGTLCRGCFWSRAIASGWIPRDFAFDFSEETNPTLCAFF